MVDIYLGVKSSSYNFTVYGTIRANINVKTSALSICSNVHKVTYQINYDPGFYGLGENYFIFNFYTGTDKSKGSLVFTCYCTSRHNVFNKIKIYYAVFSPKSPFFVTFIFSGDHRYESFEKLKLNKYKYYYELQSAFSFRINNLVKYYFNTMYNVRIIFYVGLYNNVNAKQTTFDIYGNLSYKFCKPNKIVQHMYKKVIFTPDIENALITRTRGLHMIHNGNMFIQGTEIFNRILQETVREVENIGHHGIIVYYISPNIELGNETSITRVSYINKETIYTSSDLPSDMAIFIEFIRDCNTKIQYERTSRSVNRWIKVTPPILYKNESQLLDKLEKIKASLYDKVTYEIDCRIPGKNNYSYNNYSVNVTFESKKQYVMYTHTPNKHYENKEFKVWYEGYDFKTKSNNNTILQMYIEKINVYYRNKDPYNENKNPILLVEFIEKTSSGLKKHFYSRLKKNDIIWSPVSPSTIIEMDKEVYKIVETMGIEAKDEDNLSEDDIYCFSELLESGYSFDNELFSQYGHELSENDIILSLLRQTELYFYDQITLLINQKKTYNISDIYNCIKGKNPDYSPSDKQPESIVINSDSFGVNYFCYRHEIIPKNIGHNNTNIVLIPYICSSKIYIHNTSNVPSLIIYGGDGDKCSSTTHNTTNNPKALNVFFYMTDTLPLMICYCNKLYTPSSKGEFQKWKEVETITGFSDEKILEQLNTTKSMLNLIDLSSIDQIYGFSDKFGTRNNTVNVQIKRENYSECDLFGYYRHEYRGKTSFILSKLILTINVSNINNSGTKTITVHVNDTPTVSHVDVYYSFINRRELLLVCINEPGNKSSFYKYQGFLNQSEDEFMIKKVRKLTINGDITQIDHLINEDNARNNTLTYRLDKTTGENSSSSYNNNSITINKENNLEGKGYTVYKHTPSGNQEKSTYNVLYRNKKINVYENTDIFNERLKTRDLQTLKFDTIETYVLNDDYSEQLLIKLIKGLKNYYLFRFNKEGTLWRQLNLKNLEEFGVISTEELNKKTKSSEGLGKQIDEFLKDSDKTKLLLNEINFRINSIIIVLNKNLSYGKLDIEQIVGSKGSEKKIPPIDMDINIQVTNDTSNFNNSCIKSKGYQVFKHNLTSASSKGLEKAINNKLYLQFYLENHNIQLYENLSGTGSRTYLTHQKDKNELYVYFYGKETNRPLLICYNDKAYIPKNKDSYHKKWVLDNNINKCICQDSNKGLISSLDNSRFESVLYLYEKIGSGPFYLNSKLFNSYVHQKNYLKQGDIDVYKKNDGKNLILKPSGMYKTDTLNYAVVYFNKYDDTNTPLILVLHFKSTKQLYYRLSQFDEDLKRGSKDINESDRLRNSISLQQLLEENEKLQDFLTFDIGNTNTKGDGKYNGGKIEVKEDKSVPELSNGFKKYKHTPKNQQKSKKGCIIYKNDVLLDYDKSVIYQIQGKNYNYICVYYGNGKVGSDPILLELNKDSDTEYYFQKKKGDTFCWEKLNSSNYSSLLKESVIENKIHYNLISEKSKKLVQLLKNLEFVLLNGIVLLINKKASYDKAKIENIFKEHYHSLIGITVCSPAQPNQIQVNKENCTNLERYGFNCFYHTIQPNVSTNSGELLLLAPSTGSQYRKINLYMDNSSSFTDSFSYTSVNNKFHVYFYGSDPRPLLLCYDGQSYRSKDLNEYQTKWYKVKEISKCLCQGEENDKTLISLLSEVVGFLNVVQLEQRPSNTTQNEPSSPGNEEHLYTLQTYNNQQIRVKVRYCNLNCYRVYTHEPNGISNNSSGYRLGNIKYDNNNILNYSSHQPLASVNLYYSVYDKTYSYPLLVELKFKNNGIRYTDELYELSKKNMKDWVKMGDNVKIDKMENEAYKIWKKLGIDYDKTNHLFSPDKCSEDNIDLGTAIGGGVGGVAGFGGIVGLGTFIYRKFIVVAVSRVSRAATKL